MDEDLMNLAAEMASGIDPTQGLSIQPEEQQQEPENVHEEGEESPEVSDVGESTEESNEESSEEGDAEADSDESNEDSETEDEIEESTDEDDSEPTDESNDSEPAAEDLHKVKVDGEEIEVSLQDLKDNFAGKEAWDKKFNELTTEKQEHQATVDQFNNNANQFQEFVKEGKAQEALDFLCEVAGLDRNQFVENYVSQLAPTIAEYLELSPEEREQRALKQQVEYYKNQQKVSVEAQQKQQAQQELSSKVDSVLEKHSMDLDRFESLQKELIEFGVKDLTPEAVGDYHVMVVQQDVALEVLKDINPDLVKDNSAMDYLLSLQKNNPGIKKEELKTRAEKAFIDALSDRVKKDSKAAKPRKKGAAKTTKQNALKGVVTFDDLKKINPLDLLGD